MDARTFGEFLSGRLKQLSESVNVGASLARANEEINRALGAQNILNQIIGSMEPLLKDFYSEQEKKGLPPQASAAPGTDSK